MGTTCGIFFVVCVNHLLCQYRCFHQDTECKHPQQKSLCFSRIELQFCFSLIDLFHHKKGRIHSLWKAVLLRNRSHIQLFNYSEDFSCFQLALCNISDTGVLNQNMPKGQIKLKDLGQFPMESRLRHAKMMMFVQEWIGKSGTSTLKNAESKSISEHVFKPGLICSTLPFGTKVTLDSFKFNSMRELQFFP